MNTLNLLIVEDDFSFALELELLIKKIGYQVSGPVDNAADALELISKKTIDLILMDIDIQGKMNGLQLGEKIQHRNIPILYITTYSEDEYYQKARKSRMIGYLVKPVSRLSLLTTINLAIASLSSSGQVRSKAELEEEDSFVLNEYLFFKRKKLFHKVAKSDIVAIKSEREYVQVYTRQEQAYIARMSISKMQDMLDAETFMRTHRSYIIHLKAIEKIDFRKNEIYIGDLIIPISRANRKTFEEKIKKLE